MMTLHSHNIFTLAPRRLCARASPVQATPLWQWHNHSGQPMVRHTRIPSCFFWFSIYTVSGRLSLIIRIRFRERVRPGGGAGESPRQAAEYAGEVASGSKPIPTVLGEHARMERSIICPWTAVRDYSTCLGDFFLGFFRVRIRKVTITRTARFKRQALA